MSKRIRYVKTSQAGLMQSVKKFNHPTNGSRFKVILNLNAKEWYVIDDVTDVYAASGRNVNLGVLKIEAKKALIELGVVFEVENKRKSKKSAASELAA